MLEDGDLADAQRGDYEVHEVQAFERELLEFPGRGISSGDERPGIV